jgi:F-type H+-transporting ATPase subunit gamma
MVTLRELKTRIGSVSSSEKITGAMKMISSAKVHKYEGALKRLLPFKNHIKSILGHILSAGENFSSPLIEEREVKRAGIVVFGSDDGLCGAYNINIFKRLLEIVNRMKEEYGKDLNLVIYPIGKKMLKAVEKIAGAGIEVVSIAGVDSKMEGETVNDFTMQLQKSFLDGEVDKVSVVYMQFRSMSKQILTEDQLFPVDNNAIAGNVSQSEDNKMYIFEPNPNRIFNQVLPMFVLSTMQEVTLENRASEQAARVMAMQSANDNAKKLLEELQLEYNKLRQQSITTELLDILGGQVQH